MTFSSLATRTLPHRNKYSSRQGRAVTRVIQHHWAGTVGGDTRLASPNAKASCNYLIYSNGDIVGQVPEEFRAWTSGSFDADASSITIEMQNSDAGGQWPVSDAAQDAAARLIADIAKRYGWGAVAAANYRGHREFASTACPGPFLWARMPSIRNKAHKLLKGSSSSKAPATPPTTGKSVWQLADEVLDGLHGNGPARKKSLGKNYNAVQAVVNQRLGGGPAKAKPSAKSIAQLADEVIAGVHGTGSTRKKKLGSRYNDVQAEVNRRLGAGRHRSQPNISQLADAVLRGAYGNGPERKKKLGRHYKAVQAEVNRRLGG